jgi:UDP-N-acetylglucosamine:LPS N-acetylglucosamine transferase
MQAWDTFQVQKSYREITRKGLANPEYLKACMVDEDALIRRFQPDLVMFSFRFTAGIVARRLGVPSVSVMNLNILNYFPELLPVVSESLQSIGISGDELCKMVGDYILVPDFPFYQPMNKIPEDLYKSIFSQLTEIKYIGPVLREDPQSLPDKSVLKSSLFQNGKNVILTTLGGSVNTESVIRMLLETLTVDANYIFLTGENVDFDGLQENLARMRERLPASEIIFEKYSDKPIRFMKTADLCIVHGGLSTTMEAVLCSTPAIGIPNNDEQRANFDRIVRSQSGVIVEKNHVSGTINQVIEGMLDDSEIISNAAKAAELLVDYCGGFNLEKFVEYAVFFTKHTSHESEVQIIKA